jgi:hypothetical protein
VTRNFVVWSSATTASDSHSHAAGWVRWTISAARSTTVACCAPGASAAGGECGGGDVGGWVVVMWRDLGVERRAERPDLLAP